MATGPLTEPRSYHTATLLPSGQVLVAGGWNLTGVLASAEMYDPATGSWTATGALTEARYQHTATLLLSGQVLVAGGVGMPLATLPWVTNFLPTADLYDPATRNWVSTGSFGGRACHTATLLPSGQVLVAGGVGSSGPRAWPVAYLADAVLYDEGRGAQAIWTPVLSAAPASAAPGATVNLSGTLFTGVSEGSGAGFQSSSANYPLVQIERFDSEAGAFAQITSFTPTSATATLPSSLQAGLYLLRVVVNGVPSAARPIRVSVKAAGGCGCAGGGSGMASLVPLAAAGLAFTRSRKRGTRAAS